MKFLRQFLIFCLFSVILIWPLLSVKAGPPRNPTFTAVKDGSNPILPVGPPGSWDERAIIDPNVFKESDNSYKMYYLGWNSSFVGAIGLATSSDGVNWTKYPGNPVMTAGAPGSYDHDMWEAEVRKYGDNYSMWYQASADGGVTYQSNYASSPDGINWTKYSGNPILVGGVGKWDQDYTGIRSILKIGNTYHAWYEGSSLILPSYDWNPFDVGYATSTDGIHWTKVSVDSPVLSGTPGEFDSEGIIPSVNKVGNLFVMFCATHISSFKFGLATSIDGINWTKYPSNTVYDMQGSVGEWDSLLNSALISSVVDSYDPAVYRLYYRGQNPSGNFQVGGITYSTNIPSMPNVLGQYKSDGETSISPNGYTNDTTAVFKFFMGSGVVNDLLTPQIEIREASVPFTGEPTNSGTPVVYSGAAVTGEVTVTGLENGKSYHWQAIVNNAGGSNSYSFGDENEITGADFTVDTVAPNMPTITYVTPDNFISNSEKSEVHVVGTAEPGSTVDISINGGIFPRHESISGSGVAVDGNYDIVLDATRLSDLTFNVSAIATDAAGNTSEAAESSVTKNSTVPEVDTLSSGLNHNTITLYGEATYVNGESIIDRGFQYGETTDYGLALSSGEGLGLFSKIPPDLVCGKNYHFRAYATNENGSGYGLDNTFSLGSCPGSSWINIFNTVPPKLLNPWWSFTEDKIDPRNIVFSFKVEGAMQLAISPQSDFSGISWQDFKNTLNYFIPDRTSDKIFYIKFRSAQGGETKIYSISIPATKTKITNPVLSSPTKFSFKRNLSLGSRGDDVKQLQNILKKLSFMSVKVSSTNYYGLITKQALVNLQKYYDKLSYGKTYKLKPYLGSFNTSIRQFFNEILLVY